MVRVNPHPLDPHRVVAMPAMPTDATIVAGAMDEMQAKDRVRMLVFMGWMRRLAGIGPRNPEAGVQAMRRWFLADLKTRHLTPPRARAG